MKNVTFSTAKTIVTAINEKYYTCIRRVLLFPSLILMLLFTIGVGEMFGGGQGWVDNSSDHGLYLSYTLNGVSYNQDGDFSTPYDFGTLTSDLVFNNIYLKVWWEDWDPDASGQLLWWRDGGSVQYSGTFNYVSYSGSGNNRQIQNGSDGVWDYTVARTTESSGSHTLEYEWQAYLSAVTLTRGKKTFTYTILPPNVQEGNNFTVSGTNIVSGTGTSADPFIVANGSTTVFTVTANKAHADANSRLKVSFDNGSSWSTAGAANTTSITAGSATTPYSDKRSITIKVKHTHTNGTLDCGTVASREIFYQEQPAGITVSAGSHGSVSVDNESFGNSGFITPITFNTAYNIYASADTHYDFGNWTATTNGSNTTITNSTSATTATVSVSAGATTTVTANFVEHPYTITINNGTLASTTAGISTTVGAATAATPQVGKYFNNWTYPGSNFNFANATTASSSTINFNATADGAVTANYGQKYAYIVGRFHVRDGSPTGNWKNTFSNGDSPWNDGATNIQFEYDNTNHRFYLHTYATPTELSQQLGNDGHKADPWFFVKTTHTQGDLSDHLQVYQHHNDAIITGPGYEGNKQYLRENENDGSLKISHSNSNSYVLLYFNEDYVWYDLEQSLQYNANGGSGDAPGIAYYLYGTNATAAAANTFTRTGYDFTGWKTEASSGTDYAAGASVPMNSNITLYAQWSANTYEVSFDATANGGAIVSGESSKDVTFNTAYGELPVARKDGYRFDGWYTTQNGGSQVTSSTTLSNASNHTLYAHFTAGAISSVAFTNAEVLPGGSQTVTPSFSVTPEGDVTFCYTLLTSDAAVAGEQPASFSDEGSGAASFTSPSGAADYRIQIKLLAGAGADCSGTAIQTYTSTAAEKFTVTNPHTVTIKYECHGVAIAEETTTLATASLYARVTPKAIPGYRFSSWNTDNANITQQGELDGNAITISATGDGELIANYSEGIYFKNTLGWDKVYIYFYNDNQYWDSSKGTGSIIGTEGGYTSWTHKCVEGPVEMTLVEGTSDLYYCDYLSLTAADAIAPKYVAFTKDAQAHYEFFYNTQGVRRMDAATQLAANKPMFVPSTTSSDTRNGTVYYSNGFWASTLMDWDFDLRGDFNSWNGNQYEFKSSMPGSLTFRTKVNLDQAAHNYSWKIYHLAGSENFGKNSGSVTTGSPQIKLDRFTDDGHNVGLTTTAAGEYEFVLTFGSSLTDVTVRVEYPLNVGDYRLIYDNTEDTHNPHPSDIIRKRANGVDVVSLYFAPDTEYDNENPCAAHLYYQTCTAVSPITWSAKTEITSSLSSFSMGDTAVYNFTVTQDADGLNPAITAVEEYTGDYYIRTDCVNGDKWNYKDSKAAHRITYSEYADKKREFTHYYVAAIYRAHNIRFTIANDNCTALTDTLFGDSYIDENLTTDGINKANVRFMWDKHTNTVSRAYLAGSGDHGEYLALRNSDSKMFTTEDVACPFYKLVDQGNWVYQAEVKAQPGARVKLTAYFKQSGQSATTQYFKGKDGDYSTANTEELIGGSTETHYLMRVIYDFKTNRLMTAWLPEENQVIDESFPINADVMILRNGQDGARQITFTGEGELTESKTVYAVMQFDKSWFQDGTKTQYQRYLYWISFPFDVRLNEVFGNLRYNEDWLLKYYDGETRARNGFWIDSPTNWKYVAYDANTILHKNVGYQLFIDTDILTKDDLWANISTVSLYFPAAETIATIDGTLPSGTGVSGYEVPAHICTIERDHRYIYDSNWNIIGNPSYANLVKNENNASGDYYNDAKIDEEELTPDGLRFLYEWNSTSNTLAVADASTFTFKTLHSYMVQFAGYLDWTNANWLTPASVAARRRTESVRDEYMFRLNMSANGQSDHTYIELTDADGVTGAFDLNKDVTKIENRGMNIWTLTSDAIRVAGNTMPLNLAETTVVPVGVTVAADGEYAFEMPEGTDGVGVTLVDKQTGERRLLGLLPYSVQLTAGTYEDRFVLEIAPVQPVATELQNAGGAAEKAGARKVLIDGQLYILRDGRAFDARGARIQ